MRLVVLTNILTPYRMPLFEALNSRCDEFSVLLMAEQEENRQWELEAPTFKVEVLPGWHYRESGGESSLHANYNVIKTLRRYRPDLVLSGGFAPANIFAFLYCKLFRKKYVGWGEISLRDGTRNSWVRTTIRRIITKYSSASIASSSEAKEAFFCYGASKNSVLLSPMPIDVDYYYNSVSAFRLSSGSGALFQKYGHPLLLSIGQINQRKGIKELLQIYKKVLETNQAVTLLVVGDGPDLAKYKRVAESEGLYNVHFTGYVQKADIAKYMAIADVFVFTTLFDPFGAVVSEAMAAGLPVVSSVYAAVTQDYIDHRKTGFRIDPRCIDASAETIMEAINMPSDRKKRMIDAAYSMVKQYDIEKSANLMSRFLKEQINDGSVE